MSSLLDSIDAVLFDIGSTLIMGPPISPVKELTRRFGLSADLAGKVGRALMCTDFRGPVDVADALAALGVQFREGDSDFIGQLWREQETGATSVPGALEAVQFFARSGKTIGLLSDIWPPYYRAFARVSPEIERVVAVRHLSCKTGLKKPEGAFFESALRALKSGPERTLMIGDTYDNDIAPAIDLGMRTAWILSRADREASALRGVTQGRLPRPDFTLASIVELQSAVTEELFSAYQNT